MKTRHARQIRAGIDRARYSARLDIRNGLDVTPWWMWGNPGLGDLLAERAYRRTLEHWTGPRPAAPSLPPIPARFQ